MTGAAGRIGTFLHAELAGKYRLRRAHAAKLIRFYPGIADDLREAVGGGGGGGHAGTPRFQMLGSVFSEWLTADSSQWEPRNRLHGVFTGRRGVTRSG
jgi:hypothetical protein